MSLKKEVLEDVSFFFEQYKKAAFLHIMNLDFEAISDIEYKCFLKLLKDCCEQAGIMLFNEAIVSHICCNGLPQIYEDIEKMCEEINFPFKNINYEAMLQFIEEIAKLNSNSNLRLIEKMIEKDFNVSVQLSEFGERCEYWGLSVKEFLKNKTLIEKTFELNKSDFLTSFKKILKNYSNKDLKKFEENYIDLFFQNENSIIEFYSMFSIKNDSFLYYFSIYIEDVILQIKQKFLDKFLF